MSIHEEFGCKGFFGFGGGVELVRLTKDGGPAPHEHPVLRQGIYCSRLPEAGGCPLSAECWNGHRKRVEELVPALIGQINQWEKEGLHGPVLAKKVFDEFGVEPYSAAMGGNLEDGSRIEQGLLIADRGEFTLPYPFKRKN